MENVQNVTTQLCVAASNGHGKEMNSLIKALIDVDKANIDDDTPLLVAAMHGRSGLVEAQWQRLYFSIITF